METTATPLIKNRTVLGFVVAPLIPVLLYSLSTGFYFFVILIVAIPAAYLGALLVGVPLFFLLRRLQCLSWHYFVLGGVLAALPFAVFYLGSAETHLEVYGARNMVLYAAIGATGGLVFWVIVIRGQPQSQVSRWRQIAGSASVLFILVASSYVVVVGATQNQEGVMRWQELEFISDSRREASIELTNGQVVSAYLPAQLPYRPNCPIFVTSRRSYLTAQPIYWVNGYKDSPFVNVWSMLNQSNRDEIPKQCQ